MIDATTPARPAESVPFPLGSGFSLNAAWALFTTTLARDVRSRRLLVLVLLFTLPIVLAFLMRYQGSGWRGPTGGYEPDFAEFVLIFNLIPEALVTLTALVYASGMIQDEIEEQTLTYLLIRPLPKWAIYVAKLLATLVVCIALTATFTALTYLVIGWGEPGFWESGGARRLAKTIALFALSMTAYCSLFGFLSLLLRRSIMLGMGYILLLEGLVSNIPFVVRKLTVYYYFRVLCERWLELGQADRLRIDIETAPSLADCVWTLGLASLVVVFLAALIMGSREFRLKTPEGS